MKAAFLAALVPFVGGCGWLWDKKEREHPERRTTPKGRHVLIYRGFERGVTEAEVMEWVDKRCDAWLEARAGYRGREYAEATLAECWIQPVDDWRIPVSRAPEAPTGFAEGVHRYSGPPGPESTHYIQACLYTKVESAEKPANPPYPEWVVFENVWKHAVFPADGIGMAVLPHELDHAIGIGHAIAPEPVPGGVE